MTTHPTILKALECAHSSLSTYRTTGAFTPGQPSGWLLSLLSEALTLARTPSEKQAEVEGDNQDEASNQDEAVPSYRDVGHPPSPRDPRDPLPSDFPPPSGTKDPSP